MHNTTNPQDAPRAFIAKSAALLCLLLVAAGFSSCQTAPLAPMRPGGKTVSGQVQVATQRISVIGEFNARYTTDEFQCEVSKGGLPVMAVHTKGPRLARVEAGRRTWQGNPKFAPGFVKSWTELGAAFAGHPNPKDCVVRRQGNRMEVEYPQRHDRFVFLIQR